MPSSSNLKVLLEVSFAAVHEELPHLPCPGSCDVNETHYKHTVYTPCILKLRAVFHQCKENLGCQSIVI